LPVAFSFGRQLRRGGQVADESLPNGFDQLECGLRRRFPGRVDCRDTRSDDHVDHNCGVVLLVERVVRKRVKTTRTAPLKLNAVRRSSWTSARVSSQR